MRRRFFSFPIMTFRLPPATKALLIANAVVFVLQQPWLLGDAIFRAFALWPLSTASTIAVWLPHFQLWQLVSYGFLHANLSHLLYNALSLWMFGCALELTWGQRRFLIYYFSCVFGAGVCQLIATHISGDSSPVIGASGGIFGVMLGYGLLFPRQPFYLIFPPIRMQARTFVILCAVTELVLGVANNQSGIAHFAHLGGALTGWGVIRFWRGQSPFGRKGPGGKSSMRF